MAQLAAPAVSFVGMIRQVQRVERPVAPQSQSSAEDTPTGGIKQWRPPRRGKRKVTAA
jgi:hypothetical protein